MKRSLLNNLSANTLQLIINQLFALIIFYVLSTQLEKAGFGQINMVLAILLAVFNILSLGIDQLVIKKVAAGEDANQLLTSYCLHVIISGLLFYSLLVAGYSLFSLWFSAYKLLLLIGIGKLLIYFSMPFKQVANGLERFRLLGIISVISNIVRGLALLVLLFLHGVKLSTVVYVFIAGDALEFIFSCVLFIYQTCIKPRLVWDWQHYINLIKAALPQAGVVVITSALARFDWIFIGLFVSPVKLAEYSFAYKVYELSAAPLLALAPLLIPRFTKMFNQANFNSDQAKVLVRAEMMVAAFTLLILNICWTPLIDLLTAGKYGLVNQQTILILSLSTPLVYLNNFLWTMYFAQGRLKLILHSFLLAMGINVGLDLLLIPLYKNEGAAFAVLASLAGQCIFYISKNKLKQLNKAFLSCIYCTLTALLVLFIVRLWLSNTFILLGTSIVLFTLLLFITRQVRLKNTSAPAHLLKD
jgi:O-antigen/teichoic acid export membrane protein